MQYTIIGRSDVTLEHKEGEKTSTLVATDFNLDVTDINSKSYFIDKDDLPTQAGTKALSQFLYKDSLEIFIMVTKKDIGTMSNTLNTSFLNSKEALLLLPILMNQILNHN